MSGARPVGDVPSVPPPDPVPVEGAEDVELAEEVAARPGRRARGSAHAVVTTILANFALPASAIITAPILARALGPDDRGVLVAVCAPVNLAVLLLAAGQWDASSFFGADRSRTTRAVLLRSGAISAAAAVVGVVGLLLLGPVLLRQHPGTMALYTGLVLLLLVYMPANTVRGLVLGRGDFGALNLEKWSAVGTRLVLIVVLALTGSLTVGSAAWVTQGTVALAVLALLVSFRRGGRGRAAPGAHRTTTLREVASYGSRVWVGGLSVVLIYRADQVIMTPLTAAAQLGYYSVAVAVAEVPTAAFAALRDIAFSRTASRSADDFIPRSCRLAVLLGIPCVAVAVLAAPLLVRVVFGADFGPAAPMMQVLLVASLPAGLASVCGAGLNALDRPGTLSAVQAGVAVLNVALTFALVPSMGGMGAAVATLVAFAVLTGVTLGLYCRLSHHRVGELLVPRADDARALVALLRRAPA